MNPHHGVKAVVFFRQVRHGAGGFNIASHIHHGIQAVFFHAGDNCFSIVVKCLIFQMGMGVYHTSS